MPARLLAGRSLARAGRLQFGGRAFPRVGCGCAPARRSGLRHGNADRCCRCSSSRASPPGRPDREDRGMEDSARGARSDAEERAAARARRDVVVFVVVVASVVAVLDGFLIFSGSATAELAFVVLAMMWTPGLVAVVLRRLGREGFADVSFRPFLGRGWRWYVLAWLLPLLVGGIAYGVGWFSGLAPPAAGVGLAGATALLARTMTVA